MGVRKEAHLSRKAATGATKEIKAAPKVPQPLPRYSNEGYPSPQQTVLQTVNSNNLELSSRPHPYLCTTHPMDPPVGGRLQHYWPEWVQRGANGWVVLMLRWGYRIEWLNRPPLCTTPSVASRYSDPALHAALAGAIQDLLSKRAIEPVMNTNSPGFYSRLFLTPKATGGWRPIIDLKRLNPYVKGSLYKQETPQQIRLSLYKGMWAISLDLKDAFFHIPIREGSRKYLRFSFEGKVYQYRALPFGLKTAPWIFTKVISQVLAMPELKELSIHPYLDDWITPVPSFPEGIAAAHKLVHTCTTVGLKVNIEKSMLIPCQNFDYLGTHYDLVRGLMGVTTTQQDKITLRITTFLSKPQQPAIKWLSVLGLLGSQEKVVRYGRCRIRTIQWALKSQWQMTHHGWFQPVWITPETRQACLWWADRSNTTLTMPIHTPTPDVTVTTDASTAGWGGFAGHSSFHGTWSREESSLHINCLETRAIRLTLEQLLPPPGSTILCMTDNTSALCQVNKQGGTRSWSLHLEAQALFRLAESHRWLLTAKHIPGSKNVLADLLSRRHQIASTEWTLKWEPLLQLFEKWG